MKRPWSLSPDAQVSFQNIAIWTMEKFGYDQAEAYQAKLISAFDDIADGNFPRRNGKAIWSALVRDNLLVARVGSHFVLFLETELEVVIVDILHQVMDIPGRLGT